MCKGYRRVPYWLQIICRVVCAGRGDVCESERRHDGRKISANVERDEVRDILVLVGLGEQRIVAHGVR
jgi:hypothetical protein